MVTEERQCVECHCRTWAYHGRNTARGWLCRWCIADRRVMWLGLTMASAFAALGVSLLQGWWSF